MAFSFTSALSGLRANSDALGVTGSNIANANTTAYKSSSISFADVYNSSRGVRLNGAGTPIQTGSGVRTAAILTDFTQGGLVDTGNATSAAIQGNGFFVVRDQSGTMGYTRAGDFTINRDGFLVTPNGGKVQGYSAIAGSVPPDAPLEAIQFPIGDTIPPEVTSQASLRINLDNAAPAGTGFHAPVQVFDTRGAAHTVDMTFTRQADGSYLMNATLNGNPAQTSVDGGAASSAPVPVTFDANGALVSPDSLAIVPDQTNLNGANLPSIEITLRDTNPDGSPGEALWTNYSSPSGVGSTSQNGYPAGTPVGLTFSTDASGTVFSVFSNGQTLAVGQLALATFNSETSLSHLGGNLYSETPSSGQPSIGMASSGGRGEILGGVVEQSNVDIATEFTNLIIAQRGFQSNSRVITTINETLQQLMQSI